MGAHVVTIESARALPGGGYDWGRKLSHQLTPEEMPVAIGVLMNLTESARFGQDGGAARKVHRTAPPGGRPDSRYR